MSLPSLLTRAPRGMAVKFIIVSNCFHSFFVMPPFAARQAMSIMQLQLFSFFYNTIIWCHTVFLISKSSLLPQPNLHEAVIHRIAFLRAIYKFLVNKRRQGTAHGTCRLQTVFLDERAFVGSGGLALLGKGFQHLQLLVGQHGDGVLINHCVFPYDSPYGICHLLSFCDITTTFIQSVENGLHIPSMSLKTVIEELELRHIYRPSPFSKQAFGKLIEYR